MPLALVCAEGVSKGILRQESAESPPRRPRATHRARLLQTQPQSRGCFSGKNREPVQFLVNPSGSKRHAPEDPGASESGLSGRKSSSPLPCHPARQRARTQASRATDLRVSSRLANCAAADHILEVFPVHGWASVRARVLPERPKGLHHRQDRRVPRTPTTATGGTGRPGATQKLQQSPRPRAKDAALQRHLWALRPLRDSSSCTQPPAQRCQEAGLGGWLLRKPPGESCLA